MHAEAALDPDAVAAAVARNVRSLRRARGWTLATLAARSGVSKGMVVEIEQSRTNPSIATVCRLAAALGVGLAHLLDVGAEPVLRTVSREDAVRLWRGAEGGWGDFLVGSERPAKTELWDWTFAPGDAYQGQVHSEDSREMIYVLEGEVALILDHHNSTPLPEGTAALYTADRPHRIANPTRRATRVIMVLIEGDGVA